MSKIRNLTGTQFGRLTVLRRVSDHLTTGGYKVAQWECRCDCGNLTIVLRSSLCSGLTRSCGKHASENAKRIFTTHGGSYTSEYNTWRHMRARCYNPKYPRFRDWGGRGITVCVRWRKSFTAFIGDMGPKPSSRHTIDRINNNGNYTPRNCRWATPSQQQQNRRIS